MVWKVNIFIVFQFEPNVITTHEKLKKIKIKILKQNKIHIE